MIRESLTPRSLLLLALAVPAGAQIDVVTVDDDGPADFSDLQAAIDAAPAGAAVLVASGSYGDFEIASKSLDLVADRDAVVRAGAGTVRDLAADQRVVLHAIRIELFPASGETQPLLSILDCEGHVLVEGVTVEPPPGSEFLVSAAVWVRDSDEVLFVRSTVVGSEESQGIIGTHAGGTLPGDAVHVVRSRVALFESELTGGDGADTLVFNPESFLFGRPGRAGVGLSGGFVFAADTRLTGGKGGDGAVLPLGGACFPGRPGGSGASVTDGGELVVLSVVATGGSGGTSGGVPCVDGLDGKPIDVADGKTEELFAEPQSLEASRAAREGELLTVTFRGTPGGSAFVAISFGDLFCFTRALSGVLALPNAPAILSLGAVPGSGVLVRTLPVPELGPGIAGVSATAQGLAVVGPTELVLSSPTRVLLLDGSF